MAAKMRNVCHACHNATDLRVGLTVAPVRVGNVKAVSNAAPRVNAPACRPLSRFASRAMCGYQTLAGNLIASNTPAPLDVRRVSVLHAKPNVMARIAETTVAAAYVVNAKEALNAMRPGRVAVRAMLDSAVMRVTSGK
jgi:hypothetical protein